MEIGVLEKTISNLSGRGSSHPDSTVIFYLKWIQRTYK